MSPLRIEAFNSGIGEWVTAGKIYPGDQPGSISQNKPDGEREIYLFECKEGDEKSVIYRSKEGFDISSPTSRTIGTAGLETVATLKDREHYEISIKTDKSEARTVVRFTHRSGEE